MTKPYAYQRQGIIQIEKFGGRALLADEMGLGKSAQALWWAKNFLEPKDGPIVIVCPASIKWNWQRECSKHCNLRAEVLEHKQPPHKNILRGGNIFIINYNILGAGRKSWLHLLRHANPQLVIVDECQYIKNRGAQRTKAVKLLCKHVPHVIMISGTPLTYAPVDLFPAVSILHPQEFPSFTEYAYRYSNPQIKPWGMEFKDGRNLEELHERLINLCMIRRRKSEVLSQLPDKTRDIIIVELDKYEEYARAEKDFINWLREQSPSKARRAMSAERLVRRGYLRRLAGELKLEYEIDWIKQFLAETDRKLIVFGVHKKVLKPLHAVFHRESVIVDGSVTGRDRQMAIDYFTKRAQKRIFFGNYQAAGVGWNGTAASDVAALEYPWLPGELIQAEDRAHRIGQTRGVFCHYFAAKDTIDGDLCDLLQERQKNLTSVLDGDHSTVELDIGLKLEQRMAERLGVEL